MAIGDIFEFKIFTQAPQQVGINIRHYRVSNIVTNQVPADAMADQLATNLRPLYLSMMETLAVFAGITARKIHPLPVELESTLEGLSGPGTVLGDPLPRQVSGVLTLGTPLAGRANRGRLYMPFPAKASSDAFNVPEATYKNNLQSLGMALISSFTATQGVNSTTLTPVIWRRGPRTFTDLTRAVAQPRWGTQRRRGNYGRPNPPVV